MRYHHGSNDKPNRGTAFRASAPFRPGVALLVPFAFTLACLSAARAIDPPGGLDELVALYRELGLPVPPKGAALVRYEWGGGGVINGKAQPPSHRLGLRFPAADAASGTVLLDGLSETRVYKKPK